jgi:hypothetical protein
VVAPQFRTWFGFGGSTVGLWLFLRQSLWWRLIQVGAGVFTAGAGHGVELEAEKCFVYIVFGLKTCSAS